MGYVPKKLSEISDDDLECLLRIGYPGAEIELERRFGTYVAIAIKRLNKDWIDSGSVLEGSDKVFEIVIKEIRKKTNQGHKKLQERILEEREKIAIVLWRLRHTKK